MPVGPKHRVFFIAGVLLIAAFTFAIREGVGPDDDPMANGESLDVTDEEVQLALESLQSDRTFMALTEETTWSIAERLPNINGRTAGKAGVGLMIALATPVSSSGPWKNLHCQGTAVQEFEFPYTGISVLHTVFTLDGQLQALRPLFFESYPSDADIVELEGCPIGFEDEEN